jgi:hypothetical protein
VREVSGTHNVGQDTRSTAYEIAKFADLRDRVAISDAEVISDEEFQQAKANALGRQPAPTSGDRPAVGSQMTVR